MTVHVFSLLASITPCLLLLNENVIALPLTCPVSISTLRHVTLCPQSEMEWNERAKEKGCEFLARHQNCTSADAFSYHCILNADATRLLEVCAPKWFMTGYCARFSIQEKRIINDPGLDCTKFVSPCPPRYNSTEAYKYQKCYAEVERTTNGNEHASSALFSSPIFWILIALSFGLLIALITITVIYIRGRKKETKKQNVEDPWDESCPLSSNVQKEAVGPSSDKCIARGTSSSDGNQSVAKPKTEKISTSENGKKEGKAKPEKMQVKTLSGRKSVECKVKGVQSIAELKVAVAEALNSPKELIEIVDQKTVTLYQDDTEFSRFLEHEDYINVIERTKTRESHYQDVLEVDENPYEIENDSESDENEIDINDFPLRMHSCTHITDPVSLFNHIHRKLLIKEKTKVTCPNCRTEMVTDNAFQMCDMSEDEKCFYKEKIKMNRGLKHQLRQLRKQSSVMSEYADNIKP